MSLRIDGKCRPKTRHFGQRDDAGATMRNYLFHLIVAQRLVVLVNAA